MPPIIGIDLGTTYSLVAHLGDEGPAILPNALGQRLTPSVVGLDDDGTLLVGAAAKELQVVKPRCCAALFKRYMGSDWTTTIGRRTFSAEELSSLVLRALKRDAESHFGEPVTSAVITVPAYFNNRQRQATIRAGEMAELEVKRIVNEPTAASLAYGFHQPGQEKTLLVFDLGGGTFDVSLVDLFDGALEVRASTGECFLGGEDFTRALAARLLESRHIVFERAELEQAEMVARLVHQCERAKLALSTAESVAVRLGPAEASPGEVLEWNVERRQFEEWTRPYLNRMELPLRRVLADARLTWHDLDEVILVGGATRMPAVVALVEQHYGRGPCHHLNPDEVVALGAAVQAGLIGRAKAVEDLVVTDVAPFTLGVSVAKSMGQTHRGGYFLPVINRNTTIPVSRVERLSTTAHNQTAVSIEIYQGEARRVEDNLLLGKFTLSPLPARPAGEEALDVRFTYDLNGVLEVEATVVSTGKKCAYVVTRHAHGLTPAEVEAAIEALQHLKFEMRTEEVNRYLLRRAERLFQELAFVERERLSSLLDGFEQSLEMQDRAAVESFRAALEEFLNEHDSPDKAD
ncbi:MAG: Hsp70 family protein [Pirellulales bacterium]